jgi:hypothetical protein
LKGSLDDKASYAASNPEFNELVMYLIDQGAQDFPRILINAVTGDNVDLIEWLLDEHDVTLSPDDILVAYDEAIGGCFPRSLQILLDNFDLPKSESDRVFRQVQKWTEFHSDPQVKQRCREVGGLLRFYLS